MIRRSLGRRALARRSLGRRAAALLTMVACAVALLTAPAAAYADHVRVDLRVLVVTDGGVAVDNVVAALEREGVPYEVVDLRRADRKKLLGTVLADTVGGASRARYQGVVLPNENALPADEAAAVAGWEKAFGVRQVDAYTAATAAVGVNPGWSGTLDGVTMTVGDAGRAAGFGYLAGPVGVDDLDPNVTESWAYLGTPASAAFTPLVTAPIPGGGSGPVLGAYAHDGREELVVTLAANRYQTHAAVLGHGIVTWLTRGVHLGYWRNSFSLHVDDVFLPDARWDAAANCTPGDGCPAGQPPTPDIRMTPDDVDTLLAWQRTQGLKLDLVFNGGGAVEAGGTADPLTARLLADRAQFRWINHTYEHPYLGCVQDFSVVPWRCATDPATGGTAWVSRADIVTQIRSNVDWARQNGITLNARELVTGEHSGLKSLPQMATDNPNLAPALAATGVTVLASDASREAQQRAVGAANTVPRHPMNIFYNVGTRAGEIDEYNWIYNRRADGGSGVCEDNPATSTCIAPLTVDGFDRYLVPLEANIALGHVVTGDPLPHYAHQSNLAEDRILYPVLDTMLGRYRALFATNTPLTNPRFAEVGDMLKRSAAWRSRAGLVEAYLQDGLVTVVNRGGGALDVPVTVPAGTRTVTVSVLGVERLGGEFGQAYGGGRSDWQPLGRLGKLQLRLPK